MKRSFALSMSAVLALGWAAYAQQNNSSSTTSGSSQNTAQPNSSQGQAGNKAVISCLAAIGKANPPTGVQGQNGQATNNATGASTGTVTTGTSGTATTGAGTGGTGTMGMGTGTSTTGTSTGTTGAGTAGSGSGATGASGGATTGGTGTAGAGSTGAGSTSTGSTGTGTAGTAASGSGTSGNGSAATGNAGSDTSASGTTGNGSAATGNTGATGTAGGTTGAGTAAPATTPSTPTTQNGGRVGNLSEAEICFIDKAARSNQFEIRSSQLAEKQSNNSAVKTLAQRIIKDHQQAGQRLQNVVARYGVRLPEQPDTAQLANISALQKLSGKAFDATYLAQQIAAHNEAIALFEQYSKEANDQNVRQFAAQTLPALREHLQLAKQAQSKLASK